MTGHLRDSVKYWRIRREKSWEQGLFKDCVRCDDEIERLLAYARTLKLPTDRL